MQLPPETVILKEDASGCVGTISSILPFFVREAEDGTIAVEI